MKQHAGRASEGLARVLSSRREPRIALVGAGLAGSSLALALLWRGFRGQVTLFDSRTDFSREQRWCSWGPLPEPLSDLTDASWPAWKVICGSKRVLCRLPERPYLHLYAPRFFNYAHQQLEKAPGFALNLGVAVHIIEEKRDRVRLQTDAGELEADFVFDSRPTGQAGGSPPHPSDQAILYQSFRGWVLELGQRCLETGALTLMDFNTTQGNGISFIYVLPFSADRALVESTSLSQQPDSKEEHVARIRDYLERLGVREYLVSAEEWGLLPMTTTSLPNRPGRKWVRIGQAGGALRPSSGYTLVNALRQSQAIADALIEGRAPRSRPISRKYMIFDDIFLEVLRTSPELVREGLVNMFERIREDAVVRFLSSESSFADDARLVAALPKTPFARAALRRFKTYVTPLIR